MGSERVPVKRSERSWVAYGMGTYQLKEGTGRPDACASRVARPPTSTQRFCGSTVKNGFLVPSRACAESSASISAVTNTHSQDTCEQCKHSLILEEFSHQVLLHNWSICFLFLQCGEDSKNPKNQTFFYSGSLVFVQNFFLG